MSLEKVEMVVMLGCCEKLRVLGRRGMVGGSPPGQKTPRIAATTIGRGLSSWRERGERKVFEFWIVIC